jgi:hypothetical protein
MPNSETDGNVSNSRSCWWCVCTTNLSHSAREQSIRRNKLIILLSILFLAICVFIIIGVSNILQVGSVTFFVVVVAGSLVFLWFFFALLALFKSKRSETGNIIYPTDATVPVYYFLQTIRRPDEEAVLEPVDDTDYWARADGDFVFDQKHLLRSQSNKSASGDPCPICLCDMDLVELVDTGISQCCKRPIHFKCARKYFNVVRRVQCPLCRHAVISPNASTQAPTPEPQGITSQTQVMGSNRAPTPPV